MHLEDRHGASAPPPPLPLPISPPTNLQRRDKKVIGASLPSSLSASLPPFTAEVIRHERAIAEREGGERRPDVRRCLQLCSVQYRGLRFLEGGWKMVRGSSSFQSKTHETIRIIVFCSANPSICRLSPEPLILPKSPS